MNTLHTSSDQPEPIFDRYYTELARITTGLFVGVLALMTFLLTIGLQRPHADFQWALNATLIIVPLNLIAYVMSHLMYSQVRDSHRALRALAESDDAAKSRVALQRARQRLRVMRLVQQGLFILAVLAVAFFAYTVASFFFSVPATSGTSVQ